MVTYTFPAGRFQGNINNSSITVFDAETNDPFFLSDFVQYRATGATGGTLAYPLIIDGAALNATFNGGRFYGNITWATDWRQFYRGSETPTGPEFVYPGFNSALLFPRNNVSLTLNDPEFGIRDNLNSGYVDGVRGVQAGNITVNRPRVWLCRDDWLESDDNLSTITINDGFFENLFVWLSGTNRVLPSISSKQINANNCLVHFARQNYQGSLQYNGPLKVNGASDSPSFNFNNVCLVIGTNDFTSKERMKGALANTTATNGSRLLVLGGTHVDRELITAYQNAGFSVLEDGSGDSATVEWLNRKAAFLSESPEPPPVETTSVSSVNFTTTADPFVEPSPDPMPNDGPGVSEINFTVTVP